jgi:hypothetical protein
MKQTLTRRFIDPGELRQLLSRLFAEGEWKVKTVCKQR